MGPRRRFIPAGAADRAAFAAFAGHQTSSDGNLEISANGIGSRKPARGFTLTELLIVIGIIVVLIAILLPALSKARQSANKEACLANLHSIGLAISIYTGDYKSSLPEGIGPLGLDTWVSILTTDMGWDPTAPNPHLASMSSPDVNKALNVFLCPDASPFSPTPPSHYCAHPALMPDMSLTYPAAFPEVSLQKQQRVPYKITKIPNASDIVLIFDGTQSMGVDGSANAEGKFIDDQRISGATLTPTNPGVTYLIAGYNNVDLSQSVDGGLNKDGPPTTNLYNIRWRRMGNTMANFLYVDGHTESLRYNSEFNTDLRRANLYVPIP